MKFCFSLSRHTARPLWFIAVLLVLAFRFANGHAADNYAERREVREFAAQMADKYGFETDSLLRLFSQARFQPGVIKAILPPTSPTVRSWRNYRARYIEPTRIAGGLRFWQENAAALADAEHRYGVPAEIMVAIIGVETKYGRMTGTFQTVSALATLAFDYPPRADLFRGELEEFLLLARETNRDPLTFSGSYAGALGIPQFLPSSYRRYGVDFDGDGQVDLTNSERDAIGSIANFLQQHGWQSGGVVAVPVITSGNDYLALVDGGVEPHYTLQELAEKGISANREIAPEEKCALIDLVTPGAPTEYWLGYHNFYVITRYNRSTFYAMAVYQLSQELRAARETEMARRGQ